MVNVVEVPLDVKKEESCSQTRLVGHLNVVKKCESCIQGRWLVPTSKLHSGNQSVLSHLTVDDFHHYFLKQFPKALKQQDWSEILCKCIVSLVQFEYNTHNCFLPWLGVVQLSGMLRLDLWATPSLLLRPIWKVSICVLINLALTSWLPCWWGIWWDLFPLGALCILA